LAGPQCLRSSLLPCSPGPLAPGILFVRAGGGSPCSSPVSQETKRSVQADRGLLELLRKTFGLSLSQAAGILRVGRLTPAPTPAVHLVTSTPVAISRPYSCRASPTESFARRLRPFPTTATLAPAERTYRLLYASTLISMASSLTSTPACVPSGPSPIPPPSTAPPTASYRPICATPSATCSRPSLPPASTEPCPSSAVPMFSLRPDGRALGAATLKQIRGRESRLGCRVFALDLGGLLPIDPRLAR